MLLIKNGTILNVERCKEEKMDIAVDKGKIVSIKKNISPKKGDRVIDATGKIISPGFIDAHSHLGLWGDSAGAENIDGNETSNPITPNLRAIDGIDPSDKVFQEAYEGGITAVAAGPGSANVLGGQFAAIKTYGNRVDNMVIKAPIAMKCAFGENPKRFYGSKNQAPTTRMGIAALLRETLAKAKEYSDKIDAAKKKPENMPPFDAKLHSLIPVIKREIPLKAHAHKANDIFTAIRIAKEFNLKITLEHGTDTISVVDELVKEKLPIIIGPSLGHRTKIELKNKSYETAGVLNKAGIKIAITTDSPVIPLHHLPLCAALCVKDGLDRWEALRAISLYPAQILELDKEIGSLAQGKDADIVIWSNNPLLVESYVEYTIINGEVVYRK